MNDNHLTPKWLIEALEKEFGKFDLDPCANYNRNNQFALNNYCYGDTRLSRSLWKDCGYTDGLKQKWFGKVFVNPPYSQGNIPKWIDKALQEYNNHHCKLIVMLLPSDTSTRWFHNVFCNIIEGTPYYKIKDNVDIRFLNRINFSNNKNNAKFPSMLAKRYFTPITLQYTCEKVRYDDQVTYISSDISLT